MEIDVPELVRIKPRALNKLGKYLRQESAESIALFFGEGIKSLFSHIIDISFESSGIEVYFEYEVKSSDISEIFDTSLKIPGSTKAIVAVGGGTAIDFCKYIAFITKRPLFTVPTVISNDSFCSPTASLHVKGHKKSISTKLPYSVIVDTEVLKGAPKQFIYSGMGDLFCKLTSVYDWKLSYKKTGEYVNDFAALTVYNSLDAFRYFFPKDIENNSFLQIIATSLMMTGIAMEIAGSSRPASGSEHLISHAYDKVSTYPSLHGIQTGIASYGVSYLQGQTHEALKHVMQDCGFFNFVKQKPLNREDFIEAIKLAPSIKENFYTILSEKGNINKLIDFVTNDDLMRELVV